MAKKKDIETNIVCFAAMNKWICAPEDQQSLASKKATKLLELQSSEIGSSDIVIKSINIPKFNTSNSFDSEGDIKSAPETETKTKQKNGKVGNQEESEIKFKETSANNPYAKLWSHQLIGVSTHQNAINFVYQKKLNKEDVLILKSTRANMDWWIVLFGLYKDRQTGIDNAIYLPSNLDAPWLRPLKNLEVKGFIEKF